MQRAGAFISAADELALLEGVRRSVERESMPVRAALDSGRATFEREYAGLVRLGIRKRAFSPRHAGLGIRPGPLLCALTEKIARGDCGTALHSLAARWCLAAAIGARNVAVAERFAQIVLPGHAACRLHGDQ